MDNDWISIDDQLPEVNERVLAVGDCDNIYIARLDSKSKNGTTFWLSDDGKLSRSGVEYWRRLPDGPITHLDKVDLEVARRRIAELSRELRGAQAAAAHWERQYREDKAQWELPHFMSERADWRLGQAVRELVSKMTDTKPENREDI